MQIELKELLEIAGEKGVAGESPFVVGKKYLIRTVTLYSLGRVKQVCGGFILLSDASWVADTGRFSDALKSGELSEVEPFVNDLIVSAGSVIDATEWDHDLPMEKK